MVVTVHCEEGITEPMTCVLDESENEPRTLPIVAVLDVIATVSWLLGIVVTVHCEDGITAPITMVLEEAENEALTGSGESELTSTEAPVDP